MSTGYSTPLRTPSLALVCDRMPKLQLDRQQRHVQERELAIHYARKRICICEQILSDLTQFFEDLSLESLSVAVCGIDTDIFRRRSDSEIANFRSAYGIDNRYFIWSERPRADVSHDRIQTFLSALALSDETASIVVISSARALWCASDRPQGPIRYLGLQDLDLACGLSGAEGLVLPTPGEGFDLRVAEARACGCPIFTTEDADLIARSKDVNFIPREWTNASIVATLKRSIDTSISGEKNCDVQSPPLADAAQHILNQMYLLYEEHRRGEHESFLSRWSDLRKIQADVDF